MQMGARSTEFPPKQMKQALKSSMMPECPVWMQQSALKAPFKNFCPFFAFQPMRSASSLFDFSHFLHNFETEM